MGIDKPDVRFVIHYTISKSIQNYYQESGRAGRNDEPARCIVFYKFSDVSRQTSAVYADHGLENLYAMVRYCNDLKSCRRSAIGRYFGEDWGPSDCNGMCDNCQRIKKGQLSLKGSRFGHSIWGEGLIRKGDLFTKSNDKDSFSILLPHILRVQHTILQVK